MITFTVNHQTIEVNRDFAQVSSLVSSNPSETKFARYELFLKDQPPTLDLVAEWINLHEGRTWTASLPKPAPDDLKEIKMLTKEEINFIENIPETKLLSLAVTAETLEISNLKDLAYCKLGMLTRRGKSKLQAMIDNHFSPEAATAHINQAIEELVEQSKIISSSKSESQNELS